MSLLMLLAITIAWICLLKIAPSRREKIKSTVLLFSTAIAAFGGARFLHALIENRNLLTTPDLLLTRFDGMTFNGSLLFGSLTFYMGTRFFSSTTRTKLWDIGAILTALSYGLLRIGCFTMGCCWGKVTTIPWAIKYSQSRFMPWLGIPVHPVQIYDSLLGFLIFGLLVHLYRKARFQGQLFSIFLFLYGLGRFTTEFYRGDVFRGFFLGFSTSQWVSVFIVLCIAILFCLKGSLRRWVTLVLFAWLTTGCLPTPPQVSDFKKIKRENNYDLYWSKKNFHLPIKNVLFIAADENLQTQWSSMLSKAYRVSNFPAIEDLAFWEYTKNLKDIYNIIIRIPKAQVSHQSFTEALVYLESLNEPYDVILLTHGSPNHLSSGHGYFFSYRELADLKGKLTHLNLVLLQSCYGRSLAQDFKQAGAKYVMSYSGLNRNFFFYGIFLKYYYPGVDLKDAFATAKKNFVFHLQQSPYQEIVSLFISERKLWLTQNGMSAMGLQDYTNTMALPLLD